MAEQRDILEEEIHFIDYIRILIKRKTMILVVTFSCIFLAFSYNQFSTKIFEASMVLDAPVYFDTLFQPQRLPFQEVSAKIQAGTYENKILNDLHLNSKVKNLKFNLLKSNDPLLLKVNVQLPEEYKEIEIALLNQLFKEIEFFFKLQLDLIKNNIEIQNVKLKRTIQINENLINSKLENIKFIESQKTDMENDLKNYFNDTQELFDKQKVLSNDEIKNNFLTYFLNSLIQQNIRFSREMRNQITTLEINKLNLSSEIFNLRSTLESLREETQKYDQCNKKTKNIQCLQKPTLTDYPIKPNKRKNMLMGCIFGFFLSIMVAFIAEFQIK